MTWSLEAVDREVQVIRAAVNDHEDQDSRLHAELTALLAEDDSRLAGLVFAGLAIFGSHMVRRLANALEVSPDELIDEYVRLRTSDDPKGTEQP